MENLPKIITFRKGKTMLASIFISDSGFKGTVVSLRGGSLEIMFTVPLRIPSLYLVWKVIEGKVNLLNHRRTTGT